MDSLTHGSFIWLEAVCAERNVARRYTVALSRDLFGASIVEFAWGRIGTKGQGRAVSFASEDEASRFARQLLRRRASAAWLMDAETPRARLLGMLKLERGLNADGVAALCDGGRFAPDPLTDSERAALTTRSTKDAPAHIAGDYPEWLDPQFAAVFGDTRVGEAIAMASRAPLDLRVNTLKASQDKDRKSVV